ncbi:MAG: NYN domain-containing protein [bacterium]|nr:NYN domain-containing protein [bacterium]
MEDNGVPAVTPIPVFIDENQIIDVKRTGAHGRFGFDIDQIIRGIEKNEIVRQTLHELKVFIYFSTKTEKYSHHIFDNLFGVERLNVRYIKTGSTKDQVDRHIRDDIRFWLRYTTAQTFILGTSDGGEDFIQSIDEIKKAEKKVLLLDVTEQGYFNNTLKDRVDGLIFVQAMNNRYRRFFQVIDIVKAVRSLDTITEDAQFVAESVMYLRDICIKYVDKPLQNNTLIAELFCPMAAKYPECPRMEEKCRIIIEVLERNTDVLTIVREANNQKRCLFNEKSEVVKVFLKALATQALS